MQPRPAFFARPRLACFALISKSGHSVPRIPSCNPAARILSSLIKSRILNKSMQPHYTECTGPESMRTATARLRRLADAAALAPLLPAPQKGKEGQPSGFRPRTNPEALLNTSHFSSVLQDVARAVSPVLRRLMSQVGATSAGKEFNRYTGFAVKRHQPGRYQLKVGQDVADNRLGAQVAIESGWSDPVGAAPGD